jgi:hypothetical protein
MQKLLRYSGVSVVATLTSLTVLGLQFVVLDRLLFADREDSRSALSPFSGERSKVPA